MSLIPPPQVRLELQNCVSRQQEALRCREVWLLGQIELLEQVKSETLQHQLQQLHRVTDPSLRAPPPSLVDSNRSFVLQLRGQFDLISPLLQSSSGSDLSRQLNSCMERCVHTPVISPPLLPVQVHSDRPVSCRLSSLSLTPEETPEMSFHADTRSLRHAITSFGSITAQVTHLT